MVEISGIKLHSVEEIADGLEIHPQTIRSYISKGYLRATKIGRKWMVFDESLQELLKNGVKEG